MESNEYFTKELQIIQNKKKVSLDKFKDKRDMESLYRYLLIKQCDELSKIMPLVFEKVSNYTQSLLPDNLLKEHSVIKDLMENIEEENWKNQVEIIGRLYQYYILDKKDRVFAQLKKNKKITKENIPAATQLFTPKWIVKYMIENSLGRLWINSHPNKKLKEKWKYYLEDENQSKKVNEKLKEIKNRNINPEEIKILDPSMGSGHVLAYAFDVLYDIYKSQNYKEKEIPTLILEKNLYGLDIDDKATKLAYFALIMKARAYDEEILEKKIKLNICSIEESNGITLDVVNYFAKEDEKLKKDVECLVDIFKDAKEYGSILNIEKIDFYNIEKRLESIKKETLPCNLQYKNIILKKIPSLIKQGKIMSDKYDVVCTNPPYLGMKGMNQKLSQYVRKHYKNSRKDLFAVFMEKGLYFCKEKGFLAMLTQHSWMFLSSFEYLRKNIINSQTINSMVHLGDRAFEEIDGQVVQTTAFVLYNSKIKKYKGTYIRLTNYNNGQKKRKEFFNKKNKYICSNDKYNEIPGSPIIYWISDKIRKVFKKGNMLGELVEPKQGMATTDNNTFLRHWSEINIKDIGFGFKNGEEAKKSGFKWFPYNKGGQLKKWYGNNEYIVKYEKGGQVLLDLVKKKYPKISDPEFVIKNRKYYFKEGITWSFVSTSNFGVRYLPQGFIFDVGGSSLFPKEKDLYYIIAFLCSKIANILLNILNPTMNFQVGNVALLPMIKCEENLKKNIENITKECINITKTNWDSFEKSWDFHVHPFLLMRRKEDKNSGLIEDAFKKWKDITNKQFNQLKKNEEEINKIFIEIYKLQQEITPEVKEKEITIEKADRERDVKSFISYGVGCIFGRYSLYEREYSTKNFEDEYIIKKQSKNNKIEKEFINNFSNEKENNIIPILEDDYFQYDIVSRFIEFVKITFGEDTLEENLKYIGETLNPKSKKTSREIIRKYFLNNFYKDHVKMYKKRPIYWLFNSGKQGAFKALIYMHKYTPSILSKIREEYLHKVQKIYEDKKLELDKVIKTNIPSDKKTKLINKRKKINKKIMECIQYDKVLEYVENKKIDIDLEEGVKVNYAKFQKIEIHKESETIKANLLAKL